MKLRPLGSRHGVESRHHRLGMSISGFATADIGPFSEIVMLLTGSLAY